MAGPLSSILTSGGKFPFAYAVLENVSFDTTFQITLPGDDSHVEGQIEPYWLTLDGSEMLTHPSCKESGGNKNNLNPVYDMREHLDTSIKSYLVPHWIFLLN